MISSFGRVGWGGGGVVLVSRAKIFDSWTRHALFVFRRVHAADLERKRRVLVPCRSENRSDCDVLLLGPGINRPVVVHSADLVRWFSLTADFLSSRWFCLTVDSR